MCPNCDEYAVDFEIHGPAQLRRVVKMIQAAILARRLLSDDQGSSQELKEQLPLAQLDLSQSVAVGAAAKGRR
jgi:hypothetical protein